jgi:hypothetical protein
MKRQFLAAGFLVAGTLFSGCAARGAVVVGFAPPAPRYAVIGVAPGPGYVWTEGFYEYRGAGTRGCRDDGCVRRVRMRYGCRVRGSRGHRGYEFRRGYWR